MYSAATRRLARVLSPSHAPAMRITLHTPHRAAAHPPRSRSSSSSPGRRSPPHPRRPTRTAHAQAKQQKARTCKITETRGDGAAPPATAHNRYELEQESEPSRCRDVAGDPLTLSLAYPQSSHSLVQIFAAATRAARARNLILLDRKLVVICEFLTTEDLAEREDDDVLLPQDIHHTRVAVGLKRTNRSVK